MIQNIFQRLPILDKSQVASLEKILSAGSLSAVTHILQTSNVFSLPLMHLKSDVARGLLPSEGSMPAWTWSSLEWDSCRLWP